MISWHASWWILEKICCSWSTCTPQDFGNIGSAAPWCAWLHSCNILDKVLGISYLWLSSAAFLKECVGFSCEPLQNPACLDKVLWSRVEIPPLLSFSRVRQQAACSLLLVGTQASIPVFTFVGDLPPPNHKEFELNLLQLKWIQAIACPNTHPMLGRKRNVEMSSWG